MHKLVRISGIIARYKPEPWYLVKVLDCNIVGNRKRSEKYQNTSDDRQKAHPNILSARKQNSGNAYQQKYHSEIM